MSVIDQTSDAADFRRRVVEQSLRLFDERGYDATTVDDVAAAAGTSRRTLFRQFGSKEDLIFADHDLLLQQVARYLADADSDPWQAVCGGAELVFAHFAANRELAQQRYGVVSQTASLRDREMVTASRYQRLFENHLTEHLPDVPRVQRVSFAAAVTGAHNYVLRLLGRGDESATASALAGELTRLRNTLAQ